MLIPTLALLALATALRSQDLRWDIPHRGAHVYERTTHRLEVTPPPSRLNPTVAIESGKSATPHRWRYYTCPRKGVPHGFEQANFDDSGWFVGFAGFGPDPAANGNHRTVWKNAVCCLRTHCDLGRSRPKALLFKIDHDDGVRVWLNGKLIVANDGWGTGRFYVVTGKRLDAWQRGDNTLAVQCTDIGGAQYLDLELAYFYRLPRGVKPKALEQYLRRERAAAARVHNDLFGGFRVPPLLLEGELDEQGEYVEKPPIQLHEVAWWVATNLQQGVNGGNIRLTAPRMWQLGDLKVRGRVTAADPDGWQTITCKLKTTKEPAANGDDKRFLKAAVLRYIHYAFEGELTVRRRLEVRGQSARVVEFDTDLEGSISRGADFRDPAGDLHQQEHWRLQRTHENQDTAFRLLVKEAIAKGTHRLREHLKTPNRGDTGSAGPKAARSYGSGRLAICLLALIKGGVPKDDKVLVQALDELRRRPLIDTYSLGNALMALAAYYQPATEVSLLRSGQIDRPRKRQLPEADRKLMQQWVERLLMNVDTRVDPAYLLRFNYVEGRRYDNSVHQYGLLGLYAAHLCGIDVPPIVWEAAANHLIDVQQESGRKLTLDLMDYRTHSRMQFDPTAGGTQARLTAHANGWSYMHAEGNGAEAGIWGSMTCAGITGLAICQAALLDDPQSRHPQLQAAATRARHDGFAWLADNLTVRYHPGAMTRQNRWFYYYLYGLERASLLSGVALIQDRDWYFEGAMALVLLQLDNGHWPSEQNGDLQLERTAMAILFLKQSTSPVLTGK
ncbi:MAG TPA: hypothetical protein ENI87_04445 [bacterium]|nr:hypothetical protein [bacterium]